MCITCDNNNNSIIKAELPVLYKANTEDKQEVTVKQQKLQHRIQTQTYLCSVKCL